MLAALLVTTLQILGVTMVISAVVIPASIARLLSDKFSHMIFISAGLGAFFSLLGIYLSYYFDIASGASVVLLSTMGFAAAIIWNGFVQRRQIVKSVNV